MSAAGIMSVGETASSKQEDPYEVIKVGPRTDFSTQQNSQVSAAGIMIVGGSGCGLQKDSAVV